MNTDFIVNDYILIWDLLFGASISEPIYELKQKMWDIYRKEYNEIFQDKNQILKDYKNFIPNNDTLYNIVMENKIYEKLRKEVEKYRIEIMNIWNKNKKQTDNLIHNILRKDFSKCTFFVVNKELNVVDYVSEDKMIIGREINIKQEHSILVDIMMQLAKHQIKRYKEEYDIFKKTILELAVLNEYATRLTGKSCYQSGNPMYYSLKRWLYPYWLMYLGVKKEDFFSYMMRDKIEFDANKYAYEKELQKMDIEEFIDFCIRNRRYIVREKEEIL